MSSSRRVLSTFPLLTVLGALATPVAAQGGYVIYGTGCGAPLTISSNTEPVVGMNYNLQLDQAPPLFPAFLILGTQQVAFPVFGCTVLASPDVVLTELADASGHAEYEIAVPVDPTLVGFALYNQWVVFAAGTPFGLGFSQGGCSVVSNPPLSILNVMTNGPLALGSLVQVVARGLGTGCPDNLCVVAVFPDGRRMLLRPLSIVHDPITGLDTINAVVATPTPMNEPPLGQIMIGRGEGRAALSPIQGLGAWAWAGAGTPEAGGVGQDVPVDMSMAQDEWDLAYDNSTSPPCISVTIPAGSYPSGSMFLVDGHWDVVGQPSHYDCFLPTLTTNAVLTETGVRSLIASNLQAAFNANNPGAVVVSTPGATGRIEIRMAGSTPALQPGSAFGRVIQL